MTGTSDYGSTLTFNASSIGKCIVIDFPELATDKINVTNHASGGYSEAIPSGLLTIGDITLMLLCEASKFGNIKDFMEAKTVGTVVISNGLDTFSGSGFFVSIKEESADAQGPNAVRASVVIAFTGSMTAGGS